MNVTDLANFLATVLLPFSAMAAGIVLASILAVAFAAFLIGLIPQERR